jgi:type VI secretion system protein ImpH
VEHAPHGGAGREGEVGIAAPHHAKLHFAGLLARQVRNADGLASLLSGFLRRPVEVEQFVGAWLPLPESERTRIGRPGGLRNPGAQLGRGAVLGQTVWDRQHSFRLHIGPLDHGEFETLLPDGSALPVVAALVQHYVGHEFGWDLKLTLSPQDAPRARPGVAGRLGWTTWSGRPAPHRPAELLLNPHNALRALARRRAPPASHTTSTH